MQTLVMPTIATKLVIGTVAHFLCRRLYQSGCWIAHDLALNPQNAGVVGLFCKSVRVRCHILPSSAGLVISCVPAQLNLAL